MGVHEWQVGAHVCICGSSEIVETVTPSFDTIRYDKSCNTKKYFLQQRLFLAINIIGRLFYLSVIIGYITLYGFVASFVFMSLLGIALARLLG